MPDWRWFHQLILRLQTLFQRDRVERELEEEFQFHIEQRPTLEIARGLSPAEAHSVALRAMDGMAQRKEECRDMRRLNYIDDLFRDLRYAFRNLRRNPGFAALVVLIMALGIGANTAVFSVVNTVLLKPLAFREPDRIVTLSTFSKIGEPSDALSRQVSIREFQEWHDQSSSFEAMAFYGTRETAVIRESTAEYARVAGVSPEFFRVFSLQPVAGRSFTAEEMRPGGSQALLISYAYWQSHFGGDPRALGQTVRVYGSRTIVGVLPPGFRFPDTTDLWFPAGTPEPRAARNYLAVARLKRGVSFEQAQTEMTVMVRMRGALVVAEIALAVTLVSGAGLLIKSLVALRNVALGFHPENVLVMRAIVPGPFAAAIPRARQFFGDMLSQIATLPGVLAAGATMAPPGYIDSGGGYFIDRLPPQPDWAHAPSAALSIVAARG